MDEGSSADHSHSHVVDDLIDYGHSNVVNDLSDHGQGHSHSHDNDHDHGHPHHSHHHHHHHHHHHDNDEDRSQPYANNDTYIPGLVPVQAETALLAVDSREGRRQHSKSKSKSSSKAKSKAKAKGKSTSPSVSRSPHRSRPVGRPEGDAGDSGFERERERERGRSPSWDNMRDGSISRRAAWRRPTPRWVLPFVLVTCVSVGMTIAPRVELYTDLACLAYPPRMPDAADPGIPVAFGIGLGNDNPANDGTDPLPVVPAPLPVEPPTISPGDKWFKDAQRAIHRYLNPKLPEDPAPIPLPSDPAPNEPHKKPKGGSGEPKTPSPFPEIDPALCKSDVGVQRIATRLTMLLAMTGGAVSALTTGYWASKSDRIGRRKIMSLLEVGFVVNDVIFLFIISNPTIIARVGLYVLLIGPFLEGLVGGLATLMATNHAYISDVTPDGSRATYFGRLFAMLMAGLAIGPVLGTAIIRGTSNIMSPFFVSSTVHAICALLLRFLLPESLSSESRAQLKKRAYAVRDANRERDAAEREWEHAGDNEPVAGESGFSMVTTPMRRYRTTRKVAGNLRRTYRTAFSFLTPLQIFLPREDASGRKNYNLFILAVMHMISACSIGVQQMKSLYTQKAFGWGPEQVGPYMSFMGSLRLIVLMAITPMFMYFVKPYFTEKAVVERASDDPDASQWSERDRSASPRASTESPLLTARPRSRSRSTSQCSGSGSDSGSRSRSRSSSPCPPAKTKRSAQLDLLVFRGCLFIEAACWFALGLNSQRSQLIFLIGSGAMTLGAPASPAANSLALAFSPNKNEVGRLFGAMGVLHALGSAIFAPLIFGSVYSSTVDTYAPTMFLVACGFLVVESVVSFFMRMPKNEEEERGRGRERRMA